MFCATANIFLTFGRYVSKFKQATSTDMCCVASAVNSTMSFWMTQYEFPFLYSYYPLIFEKI